MKNIFRHFHIAAFNYFVYLTKKYHRKNIRIRHNIYKLHYK